MAVMSVTVTAVTAMELEEVIGWSRWLWLWRWLVAVAVAMAVGVAVVVPGAVASAPWGLD